MLALLGRLSERIVLLVAKVAAALPLLVTVIVHVQLWPVTATPLTLFVLVADRSAHWMVTGALMVWLSTTASAPPAPQLALTLPAVKVAVACPFVNCVAAPDSVPVSLSACLSY